MGTHFGEGFGFGLGGGVYRLRFDFDTGMTRLYYRPDPIDGRPVRAHLSPLSRIFLYLTIAVVGFAVVASTETGSSGPRISRRARLVDLIAAEDARTRTLRARLDALQEQILTFEETAGHGRRRLEQLRAEADRLGVLYGLTEISGPGLAVELRDSTLRESPTGDPNDLVIHEEDLQAVVNGLWAAGAEAISINGERITTASAVRCVGNTLLLHGSVYAPPYRIHALGDTGGLLDGLAADPLVQRFRVFAEEFKLGFQTAVQPELTLPPFRGLVAANHAEPGAR